MKDIKYLNKLQSFFRDNKRLPSFDEACKLLGFSSKAAVHKLYIRLMEQEYIVKDGRFFSPLHNFLAHKVYNSIKAGFPSPWDEENSHNIDLDTYLIPRPESTIMITVQGDSMIDAGIHPKDIVIVDKSKKPKLEDIVVAEIDREYTLKYLKKDAKGYFLRAGNDKYPDFHPKEELKIFGVVTGVVRKY